MAQEVLLSPGVLLRENDQSQITSGPTTAGLALVGPTVKGRPNIPTLVTSYSDYQNKFGDSFESGSNTYEFLTSIAAYNYFQQGGQSVLVTRVASSSYAPATSSVGNNVPSTAGAYSTGSFTLLNTDDYINSEVKLVLNSNLYRFVATADPIPADDVDGKVYFYSTGSVGGNGINLMNNLKNKINSVVPEITALYDSVSNKVEVSGSASGSALNGTIFTQGNVTSYVDASYITVYYVSDMTGVLTTMGGGLDGNTGYAFELETLSYGEEQNSAGSVLTNNALVNGTKDNIRWEVLSPSSGSGTFSLIIRRGDDKDNNKSVLESWSNLSLDPNASNYIERVIGNKTKTVAYDSTTGANYLVDSGEYANSSKYVRVKSVTTPTPNYFNNDGTAKSAYFTSLPAAGTGAFGGATGNDINTVANLYKDINVKTQGLTTSDYSIAVDLLANKEEFDFGLITTPGLVESVHSSLTSTVRTLAEERGDCFYIMDSVAYGSSVGAVVNTVATIDSNYTATYWPWVQVRSAATGKLVWVPASTIMPGVYAFNDRVAAEWFAPAGLNRGGLGGAVQAERKLDTNTRDTLYVGKINPIASFPGVGLVAYGQKTLQIKASALDRVNVRRLMINLKRYVGNVSRTLLFEQNTISTRSNFLASVNPYLETVQQKQGLYAYKVVMDETNNTSDIIDRNQLVGTIYIQPTKAIEFIQLDFNITPTGVTFG